MRAIDTNILVRFLVNDHPEQSGKARAIIETGGVFVSTTVFLETEWVLRSAYEFPSVQVVAAFETFAGLPGMKIEDPDLLHFALASVRRGLDFADALHLGRAQECEAFMTFDRKLINAAKDADAVDVRFP